MSSPTPPSHSRDHSTDYYCFVAAVAIIVLLLLVANMFVVGCCSRLSLVQAIKRFLQSRGLISGSPADNDHISQLIPACKYTKEQVATTDSECSVCLMPFVDGEDVRQLPECKHSFHVPCIDMWLHSHSNCPMCRADVSGRALRVPRGAAVVREEGSQSQRSLIETGSMTSVVESML